MNSRTDKHVRAVLEAMETITPEPPPLPAASPARRARPRPALIAAGTFAVILLTVGFGALALRSGASGIGATEPETTAGRPISAETLPRYTIDLPGWRVADVIDSPLVGTAIFTEDGATGERNGAIVSVWSAQEDDSAATTMPPESSEYVPLTGYQAALAALAGAEYLGTVEAAAGVGAEAFRLDGADPEYEFLWRYSDTITVELVVLGRDYEAARTILAAVAPITEEAWADLVAQYPSSTVATTTMPPNTTSGTEPAREEPTTTTIP